MQNKNILVWISDHRYLLSALVIIVISIILACTLFSGAYVDLVKSGQYTWDYIKAFIAKITAPDEVPPVTPEPETPAPPEPETPAPPEAVTPPTPPIEGDILVIPELSPITLAKLRIWGNMFISGESWKIAGLDAMFIMSQTLMIGGMVLPCLIILVKLIKKLYMKDNTRHGERSLPLKLWIATSSVTVRPALNLVRGTIEYIRDNPLIKMILVLVWIFNLNIVSIVLPLIPFYYYFVISFDFVALWNEIRFIVFSLRYILIVAPAITVPMILIMLNRARERSAVAKLEKFEDYNMAQLEKREISTYKHGPMGTRKTMSVTDEALSLVVMDLMKADELKETCRKMFPFFPWLLFELDIVEHMQKPINDPERIYNWYTAKLYVEKIEAGFNSGTNALYGYNVKQYGMDYYNGVIVNRLFEVLKDYARLHFLYVFPSSFIISNYAIREDREMLTVGNTVRWNCDFFDWDKDYDNSMYSKIIDFDWLRMGKKFDNSPTKWLLEYGVIVEAEADKEQMNAVETLNDSAESKYPNPKNDGMTLNEKLIRHRSTIMNHCFIHILKDGQRTMSINADTREIGNLEQMLPPSKEKNALRLFNVIEKPLYKMFAWIYESFDEEIRYHRGDETLLHYAMTWINSKLYNMYFRKKNRYGYSMISKRIEAGTGEGEANIVKMYHCNGKIFADRYKTNSHAQFFEEKVKASGTGILDVEAYDSTTMSDEEFGKQNSYSRLNMTGKDWKQEYREKTQLDAEVNKLTVRDKAKKIFEAEKKKNEVVEAEKNEVKEIVKK